MRFKVNRIFCSLYIINLVRETRRHIIGIALCAVFLSAFTITYSYAGTWRELFEDANLKDWERPIKNSFWMATWKTEGGLLLARIEEPEQIQVRAADFLRWNAHKSQLNRLIVVGEDIKYNRFAEGIKGDLGLFIGKQNPSPGYAEGYMFTPEYIEQMIFSEKGVFKRGKIKARYNDRFQLTQGHLKVVFDNGKFQLFTQDILLTEFIDGEITMIDLIGLIVLYRPFGAWSVASLSTFTVSGRDISNHNSLDIQLRGTQLTTIWGMLKVR